MRRKSDPSYLRRNVNPTCTSAYGIGSLATYGLPGGADLARGAARSVTSMDSATTTAMLMGNLRTKEAGSQASSAGSIGGVMLRDSRGNTIRSASIVTSTPSSSRPALPYIAQYSDSGFSSFSSCSYLPPPPPYRPNRGSAPHESCGDEDRANNNQSNNETILSNLLQSMAINMGVQNNNNGQLTVSQNQNCGLNAGNGHKIHRSLSDYSKNRTAPRLQAKLAQMANAASCDETTTSGASPGQPVPPKLRKAGSSGMRNNAGLLSGIGGARKKSGTCSASGSLLGIGAVPPSRKGSGAWSPLQPQVGNVLLAQPVTPTTTPSVNVTTTWQLAAPILQHSRFGGSLNSDAYKATNRFSNASSYTTTNTSQLSLSPSPSMSTVSCPEYPDLQEKLHRLTMARDSLSLQVTVLNEQVGAQREKICDLEALLEAKNNHCSYNSYSDQTPSANENGKSELIIEISDLKNKFTSLEKEKMDAEHRLHISRAEIDRISQSMNNAMTSPNPSANGNANKKVTSNDVNNAASEMEKLRMTVQKLIADNTQKNIEITSLRNALDEQARAVREFDSYLLQEANGSTSSISGQPMDINAQLRKLLMDDAKENMAHSSSYPISLCNSVSSQMPQSSQANRHPEEYLPPMPLHHRPYYGGVQPSNSYTSALCSAASLPPVWSNGGTPARPAFYNNQPPSYSRPGGMSALPPAFASGYRAPASPAARQLAAELDELRRTSGDFIVPNQQPLYATASLPRTLHVKANSIASNPRQKHSTATTSTMSGEFNGSSIGSNSGESASTTESVGARSMPTNPTGLRSWIQQRFRGSAHNLSNSGGKNIVGERLSKLTGGKSPKKAKKRSTSAPNLGPRAIDKLIAEDYNNDLADLESDDELARGRQPSVATTGAGKFKRERTRSTLRNFLGRLARSSSQDLRPASRDSRVAVRSSASSCVPSRQQIGTPRASGAIVARPPIQHFVDWNCEQVCEWMAEVGFAQFVAEVARFVRSGRHLINMTYQEFEKELMMKNPLQRKRLRCLLNCIERNTGNIVEPADRMDIHQVMLWLDDIGLPQYRDVFAENLIDGQLLLCLTAQDLVEMKIISAMNHATIARGLQFLKSVDFCSHRLERRFNVALMKRCPIPGEMEKWAHSCVVQWLKSIDLSEFTPNLMFSGLHGALMVHEPTFSSESLAELLQIPVHKTLLRRHLTTHFNNCLGQEIIGRKREILAQPFVTYLSPSLKIRLLRKGFSLSRKKSKQDIFVDPDVPVVPACAMKLQNQQTDSYNEEVTDI